MKQSRTALTVLTLGLTTYVAVALSTLVINDMVGVVISKFLLCGIAAIVFMSGLFVLAVRLKRFDLVDVGWGLVFIVIGLTSYVLQQGDVTDVTVKTLVIGLVTLWGGRLALHIGRRICSSEHEDPRYVELRKDWKAHPLRSMYLRVYLVQAVLALVIMIPAIHISLSETVAWSLWTTVGVVIWVIGFVCESLADRQLRTFIADPANKGQLMTRGLWRYSRHPNYFGELTQWWGIGVICLGTAHGWVGLIGPVLISYLIICVSGIPLNEQRFAGRKGWAEYVRRTSVLIPFLPKKA